MKEITFSYNWNNKLECNCFTTLRLHNPTKYRENEIYRVTHKDRFFYVTIVKINVIKFHQINDFTSHIDTGYSRKECQNIIKKMYKKVSTDTLFDLILLKKLPSNEVEDQDNYLFASLSNTN